MHGDVLGDVKNLARLPFFAGVDHEVLQALLAGARSRSWAAGAILFHQGAVPEQLYLLRSGRVKVARVDPSGTPLTLHYLGYGDLVGCVAVFRQSPYPGTAVAVESSTGLSWPAATITALMEQYPRLALNALDIVGERTEDFLGRLQEMARETVETRVARALLRLSAQAGRPAEGGTEVGFGLSRQDLAELAGTDLYGVSRILSRWSKEGLLETHRQRILLRDPDQLAARYA